jgi:hypothetical protein
MHGLRIADHNRAVADPSAGELPENSPTARINTANSGSNQRLGIALLRATTHDSRVSRHSLAELTRGRQRLK